MYFERFWGIFFSIFSKFNPSDRRGRSQFKISPIPWLEHIPMEHLWEKSWQIHCKTNKKKWSFGVPELKKSNFKRFFDIFGLVREVRQFKNKLKLWFKTALLFSLVSYLNFFKGWHPYSFCRTKLQIFCFDWVGRFSNLCLIFWVAYWTFFKKTLKRLLFL